MSFFFVRTIIHSKKLDFFKSYFLFRFSSLFCALKFLSIFSFRFLSLFFKKVFKHLFIEILSLFFSWMFLSIFLMLRFSSLSVYWGFQDHFFPWGLPVFANLSERKGVETSIKKKSWKTKYKKMFEPNWKDRLENLSKKNTWKPQWKK